MIAVKAFGQAAVAAGILGLLYAPFHAVAYLATQTEDPPLLDWDTGFREAVPWAFDFAGPHGVYLTYGRIAPVVLAGLLAGLWALHVIQRRPEARFERRAFWALFSVHGLLAASTVVEYYTPFLEEAFLVAGPSLLLTLIGTIVYGVSTIKARIVPRSLGWMLIAGALVVVPLIALLGHIPIALSGLYIAWIWIGSYAARPATADAVRPSRHAGP